MSKAFKSWNALALAIAAATGKSWLGFPPCNQVKVLYVNLELDEEEFKVRVDEVAKAMGITRADLRGKLEFMNLKGHPTDLQSVLRQIRTRRGLWKLIVIDPVYKLITSDDKENIENNNAAIGAMFGKLEELARDLETAIFLVHHFKKGPAATTSNIDSGSGAGVFGRAPDVIFSMKPLDEETVGPNAWRIESDLRYFRKIDPFGVRLGTGDLFPLLIRDHTLDLEAEPGKNGAPKKFRAEDVVALLPKEGEGEGLTSKAWQAIAMEELECSRTTFFKLKNEAIARPLVGYDGPLTKQSTRFFQKKEAPMAIAKSNQVKVLVSKLGPAKEHLEKK